MEIVNSQPNKDEVNDSVISIEMETDNESLVSINEKPIPIETTDNTVEQASNMETEIAGQSEKLSPEEINDVGNDHQQLYHRDLVSVPLGRLIQICNRLMTKKEYTIFSQKISKYLNSLPEESIFFQDLTDFINEQSEKLKNDTENVFVYIKIIFDKIKLVKKGKWKEVIDSPPETESVKEGESEEVSTETSKVKDDKVNDSNKEIENTDNPIVKKNVDIISNEGISNLEESNQGISEAVPNSNKTDAEKFDNEIAMEEENSFTTNALLDKSLKVEQLCTYSRRHKKAMISMD